MVQVTVNPYLSLQTPFLTGLDAVAGISVTPPHPSIPDLVTIVSNYIVTNYYSGATGALSIEIQSLVGHAINGYVNGGIAKCNYTSEQRNFINTLLYGINNIPVQSLNDFILDVEDNITKCCMSTEEQIPLLIATAIGVTATSYWVAKVNQTSSPSWVNIFLLDTTLTGAPDVKPYNRPMIQEWVAAAMEGSLLMSNKAKSYGILDPTPIVGVDIVSALAGAIAVGGGKPVFRWIKRLSKDC